MPSGACRAPERDRVPRSCALQRTRRAEGGRGERMRRGERGLLPSRRRGSPLSARPQASLCPDRCALRGAIAPPCARSTLLPSLPAGRRSILRSRASREGMTQDVWPSLDRTTPRMREWREGAPTIRVHLCGVAPSSLRCRRGGARVDLCDEDRVLSLRHTPKREHLARGRGSAQGQSHSEME